MGLATSPRRRTDGALSGSPTVDYVSSAKAASAVAAAGQEYGLSQTWESLAGTLTDDGTSSADGEMNFIRHSLIDSLDSLFGQDIEWADIQARAAGGAASSGTAAESTGAVAGASELERPSAAMLAVGLALAALWSEGDDGDLRPADGAPAIATQTSPGRPLIAHSPSKRACAEFRGGTPVTNRFPRKLSYVDDAESSSERRIGGW